MHKNFMQKKDSLPYNCLSVIITSCGSHPTVRRTNDSIYQMCFCPLYKHFDLFLFPLGSNSRELKTLDLNFLKSFNATKHPFMQRTSLHVHCLTMDYKHTNVHTEPGKGRRVGTYVLHVWVFLVNFFFVTVKHFFLYVS